MVPNMPLSYGDSIRYYNKDETRAFLSSDPAETKTLQSRRKNVLILVSKTS